MSVSGSPPYGWVDGTNLERELLKSRQVCEAMQALTNRADNASVAISDWTAYDYDGNSLANLGQTPDDADLKTQKAFRHVNHIADLRTALEDVLIYYTNGLNYPPWTLTTLLQAAVGRPNYNRSIEALRDLDYFDGEDLEELLKCIDLLIFVRVVALEDAWIWRTLPDTNHNDNQIYIFHTPKAPFDPWTTRRGLIKNHLGLRYMHLHFGITTSPGQTCNVYRVTGEWSENTVTWNNRPPHDVTPTIEFITVYDDWTVVDLDAFGDDRSNIMIRFKDALEGEGPRYGSIFIASSEYSPTWQRIFFSNALVE